MKKLIGILVIGLFVSSCESDSVLTSEEKAEITTSYNFEDMFTVTDEDSCEYVIFRSNHGRMKAGYGYMALKGKQSNPDCGCNDTDTVYIYGVSMRYGIRDTVYQMYPIDSAEVAVGYLRTNGALSK